MKRFLAALTALALTLASPAFAQNIAVPGTIVPLQGAAYGTVGAAATAVDATHGLPVNCITGCTGGAGGGGDASAANQTSQITQETAINTVLGTVTASPTANTIADRLKTLNTTLGTLATTANQTTELSSLSSIATNTTGASTAANQTSPLAPIAPATATATKSMVLGCAYTSGGQTFTTTQQGAVSCGAKGAVWTQIQNVDGTQGAVVGAAPADNAANSNAVSAGLVVQTRPFLYDGSTFDMQRSSQGAVSASGAGIASVEEAGRSFANITTSTTTTVKSGAGFLHTVCINTKGASANTATIYDSTTASGTKIGTLDTTSGVGCQTYDAAFATGLTFLTATGTAADLTVSYR